jgi:hypothetical protein
MQQAKALVSWGSQGCTYDSAGWASARVLRVRLRVCVCGRAGGWGGTLRVRAWRMLMLCDLTPLGIQLQGLQFCVSCVGLDPAEGCWPLARHWSEVGSSSCRRGACPNGLELAEPTLEVAI